MSRPPRLLTARFVETVKPLAERKEYGDAGSGLRLAVYPTGAKSFVHRYRNAAGASRKDTLGPAAGAGALTLAAARETVARSRRQLEQGIAPAIQYRVLADGDNVAGHAAQFLATYKRRPATIVAAEHTFNIVISAWRGRSVQDISRRDIIDLVDAITAERGPHTAARSIAVLSRFFNWLLNRDVLTASPCVGVERPPAGKPRERVLSDAELIALLRAADTNHPADRVIWLLALTGCRRTEVGGMAWSEIVPDGRWAIPAARSKTHRKHILHLSAQAWRIIAAQPQLANCDYVFTTTGRVPIKDWDKIKKRLTAKAGITADWRLHDLRRTCASGMQRLGVRTEVIERALGHHSGTFRGIVGVYQQDPLEDEVRDALRRWGDRVEQLVEGKPAQVATQRRRR